jgi:hypothetical protein
MCCSQLTGGYGMKILMSRHELVMLIAATGYAAIASHASDATKAEYSVLSKKLARRLRNARARVIKTVQAEVTPSQPLPVAEPMPAAQVDNTVYCCVSYPDTRMFVLTASVDATDRKTKELVEKKTRAFYGGSVALVNFYSAAKLDQLVKLGWQAKVNADLRH